MSTEVAGTGHPARAGSAGAIVRERCQLLGLPTWRFDRAGGVIAEPDHKGATGLWLRCGALSRLVSGAAQAWAGEADPTVKMLFPGCWLVPVSEHHRRERSGFTGVLALSARALDDEWFIVGCTSGQLDLAAARGALRPLARFDEASANALKPILAWMAADALRAREDQETIAGFTRQLTDGFETIDLLYSLGRSMSDIKRPREFLETVCSRLHESMAFGWIVAWTGADPRVAAITGQEPVCAAGSGFDAVSVMAAVPSLATKAAMTARPLILSELDGRPLPCGVEQLLVQPILRGGRLVGLLICGDKGGDDPQVSSFDTQLLEAAGGYVGAFLENAALYADQRAMFLGTLRAMTAAIDAKDSYTRGHSERVAYLARKLALAAGLPDATAERLHISGLVHDIGKIGVPEAVLGKRGKLDDAEFAAIKLHPEIGHTILKDIPLLEDVLPGVLTHHERFDGRGYPRGLKAEEIHLFGRILALADTFDAMSSTRSYRAAMPREKVLAELQRCAGSQFDPAFVPLFVALDFSEYDAMVARHAEAEAGIVAEAAVAPDSGTA
ncbi:MAG: HD domain-containing phosphohydrolase [Phycisphaerales bacterium]